MKSVGLVMIAAVVASLPAFGAVTYSASNMFQGYNFASEATFDYAEGLLTVGLYNTSQQDVEVPMEVLTGVFFDVAGTGEQLTPLSAALANGSAVFFGGTLPGGDVGCEWAFASVNGPRGAEYGISSSGLGLFGPSNRFDTQHNLQGPADPDGLQYGITAAGDILTTGNTPVTGTNALIQNGVVFTFSVSNFSLADIANVVFQYGTSLTEPSFPGHPPIPPFPPSTPEPASIALLGIGLAGLAARRRFLA